MEDDILSPGTMMGIPPESAMDFDYMDELLLDRCWLDTRDGFEFLQQSPSNSGAIFDYSYLWPTLEANNGELSASSFQKDSQEERQRSIFLEDTAIDESNGRSLAKFQSPTQNITNVAGCSSQSEPYTIGSSELGKRWWIGPKANPGPSSSVMGRLIRALGYIRDSAKDKDTLIQIWVPVPKGNKHVLTTNDQPFSLDPNSSRLASYRDISVNYQFSADKDSLETVGLPGRVYLGKVPEWTPDVRFFRSDEYPRVDYAQRYDVRGTLALPIFERGSRTCLGVIEVVMTTQKINYRPELESVCKALEAVDLSSSKDVRTQDVKASKESYQAALPEILKVLKSACVTHRLPLAQTWVPCIQQGKGGCRHSDENYIHCVSTVDSACYVADPHVRGFQEACSEHHLLKGQGVAGRAFTTNQPCFSPNITSFSKTDYPLSHHARMFGLHAAVAIRFRSVRTGAADFVLEFFLPADCRDPEEQRKTLSSLSIIIQEVCRSLRVVTDKELEEETISSVSELIVPPDDGTSRVEMIKVNNSRSERYLLEESSSARDTEVQQNGNIAPFSRHEKPMEVLSEKFSEFRPLQEDSSCADYCNFGESNFTIVGKAGEKRRTKAEKTITLEVLRQYFAGSLKDAAKNLGVCPTTLKRVCRGQGIKRWPSRKIKKVGRSLEKLQRVIDSVQGASGTIQIGSFYSNFPELASPNITGTTPFSNSKPSKYPKPLSRQCEDCVSSPHASSKSPSSSCSQSSSSSHSSSSATQQHPSSWNVAGCEDVIVGENLGDGVMKRVRSDAELHVSTQEGSKLMPRSQSHISLGENRNTVSLPSLPKTSDRISREGDARRVKVTYGEEKIRFRVQIYWTFKNLLQEIGRRFNIDETSEFHLKYLDDDSEWILLTCDADLEECLEVCQSSQSDTIKLSLQVSDHHAGSSLGSSSPL